MRHAFHSAIAANLAAALVTALPPDSASALQGGRGQTPIETGIPVGGGTSLYARMIGSGPPVIVLHGGPDFDHGYLLPDLDRLADSFRLIYYDQRGRGRSAEGIRVEDRLMRDTRQVAGYDLLPRLRSLRVPTLVIAGDHDFMAAAGTHIARAIPNAELVTIRDCGHFAFLECAPKVRQAFNAFFGRRR